MIRPLSAIAAVLALWTSVCFAQDVNGYFPETLVIARHFFFDFGPPNDYYELTRIHAVGDGLSVERILVTPSVDACLKTAALESHAVTLHETLPELLQGKNPCAIPEKELHRELKRCKKCRTFSGEKVAMQVTCSGKERQIRMDILDRDLYDVRSNTPEQTSWTMAVMGNLDKAIGPGVMEKSAFAVGGDSAGHKLPETETLDGLGEGKYDQLFGLDAVVSNLVRDAERPPFPPPSIELVSAKPYSPITLEFPKYPPIGRAAHVEGLVTVTFDVDASGKATHLSFTAGSKILQGAAGNAVAGWTFPESAVGHAGEVSLQFKLNCRPTVQPNVN